MPIKNILVLLFLFINILFALDKENIIYVEDLDTKEISLKNEIFNKNSNKYTIVLDSINTQKDDPIEFFKKYKIKNGLVYKSLDDKKYAKILLGVYNTFQEANFAINGLDSQLKINKPYVSKISIFQKEYKNQINKKLDGLNNNKIFISNSKDSQQLKKEFLNKNSDYYSIAVASIPLKKDSVKNFFTNNNISDKALAHVYGKKKDKVRIIYGLYKTRKEAIEAIKEFNDNIKINKPFSMKMSKFQSFYKKSFPNENNDEIIELKVDNLEKKEINVEAKLSDNIRIVKNEKKDKAKIEKNIEKELKNKKVKKEILKSENKKNKKIIKENRSKVDPNQFLKVTKLEDVYFIESEGNFNILSEVFLNDNSSFFTIDLGELELLNTSIEQYYLSLGLKDNSLAYKYGDNKEYARIILGAYESKKEAIDAITRLSIPKKNLRVSNIRNHQKLYKIYHKNIEKKEIYPQKVVNEGDILYTENEDKNYLKDEFFNKNSQKYTITLVTFAKNDVDLEKYLKENELTNNTFIYSIGSNNDYYRLFYKVFDSFAKAKLAIENLGYNLKKNKPYVSRIRTNQKKFESYNNRKIKDYKNSINKLDIR